jgi:hypothetical protein
VGAVDGSGVLMIFEQNGKPVREKRAIRKVWKH